MESVWSKRVAAVMVVAVCAATIFAVPTARARSSLPRPAFTSHSPILIAGDSEFTSANGVTGGSGTTTDPYVISGWDIDSSSTVGIRIRNTTAYAAIRGIHIRSNQIWSGNGFFLTNVQHVRVENSTIEYNSLAFEAISSLDVKIATCTLHFNDETVNLGWTNHAWVEANTIDSNGAEVGVSAQTSQDIVVGNNSFTREAWSVSIVSATDTLVLGNIVRDGTGSSFVFSASSAVRIENTTLLDAA